MTNRLAIALAQLNPVVGAIDVNLARARDACAQAVEMGAELIVFSELFIIGYPPEDLVLKPAAQCAARHAVETLAASTAGGGPGILIGVPWAEGGKLYNAVALLDDGEIKALRYKCTLPNYGVFDEKRVFTAGPAPAPFHFRNVRIGVPICEDIWTEEVCRGLREQSAEFFLVPNGSPFDIDKADTRLGHAIARVGETGLAMAYLNQIGGQDELVFEGASFALNADCSLALQLPAFKERIVLTQWRREATGWVCMKGEVADQPDRLDSIYRACTLGLRDYVDKNGFPGVILGLSGGIDSALCAAIANDALGADRVHCMMLPYKYTASASLDDAAECARALGVAYDVASIAPAVDGFDKILRPLFAGRPEDVTEENIQSRVRGSVLMAMSNKLGLMVLATGNKSELSVGYATLYGDMNGGFNPIKDLYKTQVYALARRRNHKRPQGCLGPDGAVIAEHILAKSPSAELRPGQSDQDSLPPYDTLDDILECLVERDMALGDIVARGHERETVLKIEHLLYKAEYKRRQAPPGVMISTRHFGRARRYPITNRFRDRASCPTPRGIPAVDPAGLRRMRE
ncbi:MAG: NAD+ synthase [Hyphomicrobiales bacterium]